MDVGGRQHGGWWRTGIFGLCLLCAGCLYGAACSPIDMSYSLCLGVQEGGWNTSKLSPHAEACAIINPVEDWENGKTTTTLEPECMDLPGTHG